MTDAEIIKALECCVKDEEVCVKECPLFRTAECVKKLHKLILDLIHRQQEEINHFVEANKMVVEPKTVETDKTEDEILKRLLTQRVEFIPNNKDIKDIQRDAVINSAERLKRMMFITDYDIDDLVNKMFPKGSDTE